MKKSYPDATSVGLSDGADGLLPWLAEHTSGYGHAAAPAFRHGTMPEGEGSDYGAQETRRYSCYDTWTAASLLAAFEQRPASTRRLSGATRTAFGDRGFDGGAGKGAGGDAGASAGKSGDGPASEAGDISLL